jgi:cytoskeletal protein CcmA (bactofilin family)
MGILGAKKTSEPAPVMGGLSIVAVGVTVRGDIESNGTVKVEGAVEGQVEARNQVLVAKGGVVQGDIEAREAVVGGAVHGAIRATERVEIQSGAVVNGDIMTRRISVAEGGSLNGQIRMTVAPPPEAKAPDRQGAKQETRAPAPAPVTPVPGSARSSVPVARVAVPPRLPSSGY